MCRYIYIFAIPLYHMIPIIPYDPIIYRASTIQGDAGFLQSTVSPFYSPTIVFYHLLPSIPYLFSIHHSSWLTLYHIIIII